MGMVMGQALANFCVDKVRTPAIPYHLGWQSEQGTDCINLIGWGLKELGGRALQRSTNLALQKDVERIARLDSAEGKAMLVPGALLFIVNEPDGRTEHAGIYVGNIPGMKTPDGKQGNVVHASASRGGVYPSTLQNAWTHVWWAKGVDYTGNQTTPTIPEAPAPTAPTVPREPGEGQAIVTASSLRLRKNPSSTGAVIVSMPEGNIVPVLEERNGWARVRYVKGGTTHIGWASVEFLRFGAEQGETEAPDAPRFDVIIDGVPLDVAAMVADFARPLGATANIIEGRG